MEEKELKRINASYIFHEVSHILHLERGIFFTIARLFVSPGKTINEFLSVNRSKIVKPIVFIIIITLFFNLTNKVLHFQDDSPEIVINNDIATIVDNWFTAHLGYYNIIFGFLVALLLKLFYLKSKYNIYEILVLMCYVIAIDMLLAAITGIFSTAFSFDFINPYIVICLLYTTYAVANFFGKNKWYNYIIAVTCFLLGMIIITILPDLIKYVVKLFINKQNH